MKSVMAQTYQGSIECLIVDDCSTDKGMDVVKKAVSAYLGPIVFKILHHEHNRGLSAARNTGMDAATGDYLFFLDSDDEISADCIERLAATLKEMHYDLIVGSVRTVGNESLHRGLSLKLDDGVVLCGKEIENSYHDKWKMIAVNKLYRKGFIQQQDIRFKEGLVHEDELWSLQVACLAQSLRAVNKDTYIYYVREGSITTDADVDARRCSMLKVIVAEIGKFLEERHIFSQRAYQLMLKFFWQSLEMSWKDKNTFLSDYVKLREESALPLPYRVRACGLHPRAQLQNVYYMMAPQMAANIIYFFHNLKLKLSKGDLIFRLR